MDAPLARRCLAEFVGTLILVFMGTGAVVVDAAKPDSIGHVGISLCFGIVVMIVVYSFGSLSGAHINPAVTLAFSTAGKFPLREIPVYMICQFAGAIAGSFLVLTLLGNHGRLGATTYTCPTMAAIGLEFMLSLILMVVILNVTDASMAPLAIGATIALEAMMGGPITGASMNPARSLGPALVGQDLGHIWIYLMAPCLGTVAGVGLTKLLRA